MTAHARLRIALAAAGVTCVAVVATATSAAAAPPPAHQQAPPGRSAATSHGASPHPPGGQTTATDSSAASITAAASSAASITPPAPPIVSSATQLNSAASSLELNAPQASTVPASAAAAQAAHGARIGETAARLHGEGKAHERTPPGQIERGHFGRVQNAALRSTVARPVTAEAAPPQAPPQPGAGVAAAGVRAPQTRFGGRSPGAVAAPPLHPVPNGGASTAVVEPRLMGAATDWILSGVLVALAVGVVTAIRQARRGRPGSS